MMKALSGNAWVLGGSLVDGGPGFAGSLRRSRCRMGNPAFLLALLLTRTALASPGATPVTPHSSPEAQALMACFLDIYGKKVLSGQQQGWLGTNELGFELGYIHEITGKLPAVRAMDLAGYTRAEPGFKSRHEVARKLVDWYAKSNGIAALCWHWAAPMGEKVVYVKETKFDLSRGLVEGTPEHEA